MSYYSSINYGNDTYDAYADSYMLGGPSRRNGYGEDTPEVDPYANPYETGMHSEPDYTHGSYGYGDAGLNQYQRRRADEEPDRQCQQTHPNIQPAVIPVPSSSYLELSAQLSSRVADPTLARKLLILDLNGTLLFREPRVPLSRRYSGRDRRRDRELDPYANPRLPRPLRPVHPRPYMRSFKEYLFHPQTKKWLDTMVWSSAQPHSVKDMVGKCFGKNEVVGYGPNNHESGEMDEAGSEEKNLVAIWGRDTLGLDEDAYYKKTQTTKDLSKPWKLLPSLPFSGPNPPAATGFTDTNYISNSGSSNNQSRYTTVDTRATSPKDVPISPSEDDIPGFPLRRANHNINNTSTVSNPSHASHLHPSSGLLSSTASSIAHEGATSHSAKTTLLLDDSPLKARMQPYNHVCVPEYGSVMRMRDVRIARTSNSTTEDVNDSGAEASTSSDVGENADAYAGLNKALHPHTRLQDPNIEQENLDELNTNLKKRKRSLDSLSVSPPPSLETIRKKHYDHTLLAVIGLLSALKYESSVAGWIKAGGLFNSCADHPNAGVDATDDIPAPSEKEPEMIQEFDTEDSELDALYLASIPEGVEAHDVGTSPDGKSEDVHGKKKKERWRNTKRRRVDADGSDPASTNEGETDEFGRMARPTEGEAGNDIGVTSATSVEDGIPGLGLVQNAPAPSVRVTPASEEVLSVVDDIGVDSGVGVGFGSNDDEIVLDPSIVDLESGVSLALPSTQASAYDGDVELETFDNTVDVTLASTQPDSDGDVADVSLAVSDSSELFLPSSPLLPRPQSFQSVHTQPESQSQSQSQLSQSTQPSSQPSLSQLSQTRSQPRSQSHFSLSRAISRNPSLTSLQPTEPSSSAEKYERMKKERVKHLMPRPRRHVIPLPPKWGEDVKDASSSYLYGQANLEAHEKGKPTETQSQTQASTSSRPPQDSIPSAFLDDSIFSPRSEPPPPTATATTSACAPPPQQSIASSARATSEALVPASDSSSSAKSEPIVRDFAYEEPYSSTTLPPSKVDKNKEEESSSRNHSSLPPLWYQHPPARWYWVRRGLAALKELGIEVVPGVDVD